jgi:hypothetical protein
MRFARCQIIAVENKPIIPTIAKIMLTSDQITMQSNGWGSKPAEAHRADVEALVSFPHGGGGDRQLTGSILASSAAR